MENIILGAFALSVKNGGVTFNLNGKAPEKGYMVSIVGQEVVIPELVYVYENLEDYINERISLLNSMSKSCYLYFYEALSMNLNLFLPL